MTDGWIDEILCIDCKHISLWPHDWVDFVFTSPPYADMKQGPNDKKPWEYAGWLLDRVASIAMAMKEGASLMIVINDKVVNGFRYPYVAEFMYEMACANPPLGDLVLYERLFWNKSKRLQHRNRFGDSVEYILWYVKGTKPPEIDWDQMRVPYAESSIKRMEHPIINRYDRKAEHSSPDYKKEYKPWKQNPKGAMPSTLVNIGSECKKISDLPVPVFPEKLVEYFLLGVTKPGDMVLDPFCGTGTTCVAARRHGRHYVGIDISEECCTIARERLNGV